MAQPALEELYPGIPFQRRVNLWERLSVPECIHLERDKSWIARFSPDTFINGGSPNKRTAKPRPEVALCRACLLGVLRVELSKYAGRVVALEPYPKLQQYFFTAKPDLKGGGFDPDMITALSGRLAGISGPCQLCKRDANWLWFSSADVEDVHDVRGMTTAAGLLLCAEHGVNTLCDALGRVPQANIENVNAPYGESGVYAWVW